MLKSAAHFRKSLYMKLLFIYLKLFISRCKNKKANKKTPLYLSDVIPL